MIVCSRITSKAVSSYWSSQIASALGAKVLQWCWRHTRNFKLFVFSSLVWNECLPAALVIQRNLYQIPIDHFRVWRCRLIRLNPFENRVIIITINVKNTIMISTSILILNGKPFLFIDNVTHFIFTLIRLYNNPNRECKLCRKFV